jgi:hypothetical protein
VLSANGKGLAWGSAGNQIDAILPLVKLNVTHVLIEKAKVVTHRLMPVLCKSSAGIFVALNYRHRLKTCLVQTKRKPASAGK